MNAKLSSCVFLVAVLFGSSNTHAATLYFDGGAADILTDGNGASTSGVGTWNTTLLNWDAGVVPHVAWNNADDAVIAGTATISIGVPVTANTLTFTSGAVAARTISGSEITINNGMSLYNLSGLTWSAPIKLGGNQTWTHSQIGNSTAKGMTGGTALNGYTLTWDSNAIQSNNSINHSNISGTGSIIKNGTGWIRTSGTYIGSTTVNNGTLSAAALGNVNNQLTVNGGTLNIGGGSPTVGNLDGTGGVITGSSGTRTLTIGSGDNGGGNFQGVIENGSGGTTALTKIGTGTITLSGANTYTGATTINGGTLVVTGTIVSNVTVAAAGSLSPVAGGAGTLTIGGNLDISAMAGGTGKLKFELGAPGASDQIAVSGTLTIGTGVLGLSDFDFTNLGGMAAGTYTLITSGGITGTLNSSDLSGSISGQAANLQINVNSIELVVIPSGMVFILQ